MATLSRLDVLQRIVDKKQAAKIRIDGRKVTVDLFTASMLLRVYNALNEQNREKFINLPWPKMVSVGWKLVG